MECIDGGAELINGTVLLIVELWHLASKSPRGLTVTRELRAARAARRGEYSSMYSARSDMFKRMLVRVRSG